MDTVSRFTPDMVIYPIDKAFLLQDRMQDQVQGFTVDRHPGSHRHRPD